MKFVPLDKSIIIRVYLTSLLYGHYKRTYKFCLILLKGTIMSYDDTNYTLVDEIRKEPLRHRARSEGASLSSRIINKKY